MGINNILFTKVNTVEFVDNLQINQVQQNLKQIFTFCMIFIGKTPRSQSKIVLNVYVYVIVKTRVPSKLEYINPIRQN